MTTRPPTRRRWLLWTSAAMLVSSVVGFFGAFSMAEDPFIGQAFIMIVVVPVFMAGLVLGGIALFEDS